MLRLNANLFQGCGHSRLKYFRKKLNFLESTYSKGTQFCNLYYFIVYITGVKSKARGPNPAPQTSTDGPRSRRQPCSLPPFFFNEFTPCLHGVNSLKKWLKLTRLRPPSDWLWRCHSFLLHSPPAPPPSLPCLFLAHSRPEARAVPKAARGGGSAPPLSPRGEGKGRGAVGVPGRAPRQREEMLGGRGRQQPAWA